MYLPCNARCNIVFPQVVITMANEVFTHILHFAASKRSAVVEPAVQHAGLAGQQLNQLPHLWDGTTQVSTFSWSRKSVSLATAYSPAKTEMTTINKSDKLIAANIYHSLTVWPLEKLAMWDPSSCSQSPMG